MDVSQSSPPAASQPSFEIEGLPKMSRVFQMGTWLVLLVAVILAYSQAIWLAGQPKRTGEPTPEELRTFLEKKWRKGPPKRTGKPTDSQIEAFVKDLWRQKNPSSPVEPSSETLRRFAAEMWLAGPPERYYEPTPKFFALDNKFIILEDPRLRVNFRNVDQFGRKTWKQEFARNFKLIWNQDYWWPKAVSGLFRPTTNTSYMVNYSFLINDAGRGPQLQSAAPYVVVNVFMHFLNCVLVFYLVALLAQRPWPAALAALLWAVHPVCVETVANIVGRADEFSCFFAITSFLAYFKMGRAKSVEGRLLWLTIAGVLLMIGLTAKENTVIVVFMVLLFDFIFRPQWRVELAKADWIFAGIWAVFFMIVLFGIIRMWDLDAPANNAIALAGKSAVDTAAWANAFKYAAKVGLALAGLAAVAALGVATLALMDKVFPDKKNGATPADAAGVKTTVGPMAWLGRAYVAVMLVVSFFGIMPLVDKLFGKNCDPNRTPWWRWLLARVPAYLVIATPILFWMMGIRSRLFAGMREPELPFVDNPLVWFWEDGLGGRSILSFVTNSIKSLTGPVLIYQHDGTEVVWSWGHALSQMIPGWLSAIKVVGRNIMLMIFPAVMSPDYSYNHIPLVNFNPATWQQSIYSPNASFQEVVFGTGMRLIVPVNMIWANTEAFLALGLMILLLVIALIAYFRFKPTCFFLFLVFLTMLPTMNVLFVMGSIMAERFLYVPTMGISVLMVFTLYGLCRKYSVPIVARYILIGICIIFAVRSWYRTKVWESDVQLWESAVVVCPNSFKTHKSLAYAWYERSNNNFDWLRRTHRRWGEEKPEIDWIIDHARQAIWCTRESQIVFVHLGAYLRIKGDTIHVENMKYAGQPPDKIPPDLQDPRPFYVQSAEVLAAAIPLDREFNARHHRFEKSRGKTPEQIADIGNYEIYWNLGIAHMRIAALDQQLLATAAQRNATEQEKQMLAQQLGMRLQNAISAFEYMRHLAPGNVDAHLNMGLAYWQLSSLVSTPMRMSDGRTNTPLDEAAISFLCALLLDNNRQDALQQLAMLYDRYPNIDPDPNKRPILPVAPGGFRLNTDSPLVVEHIRHAYKLLYKLFLDLRERNFAVQIRDAATKPPYNMSLRDFPEPPPLPPIGNLASSSNVAKQAGIFFVAVLALGGALFGGVWFTNRVLNRSSPVI